MNSAISYSGVAKMPLSFAGGEETCAIKKIGGGEESRKFLESLGLVTGGEISVVSKNEGGMIVNVKNSRLAISREMADRIMVESKRGIVKE